MFRNLYIHYPYCETKCHYCDFFSLPESMFDEEERRKVFSAIEKEFLNTTGRGDVAEIDTLFIGGGTPSLVPIDALESMLSKIKFTAHAEITMEANPSSVTFEKAKEWKRLGIRRISMGVQALRDERLKWLSRVHSKDEVFCALDAMLKAGIPRVSIDYIVGVPGQTLAMIEKEISDVLKRYPHIQHLSAYLLTLQRSNAKFKELPGEEEQLLHLRCVRDVLADHGFEQYEISNFARSGARARHNENYWASGTYLGVGPSAHSYDGEKRWKNWASLGKYVEKIELKEVATEWSEEISLEQKRVEFLMLGLRRKEGVSLNQYRAQYSEDLLVQKKSLVEQLASQNLLRMYGDTLRLCGDGFFLSDAIIAKLI